MTFTPTYVEDGNAELMGTKKVVLGTFENTGGSTGGTLNTSLNLIESIQITLQGITVSANSAVYNATLPLSSSDIAIVTDANRSGSFMIIGE